MKKILFLLFLGISLNSFCQVTTSPGVPTANDEIVITFDATGTGLDGYTGDIYAHTGVTVDGNRWQNVIGNWGDNSTQPKLTKIGTNLFQFTITPNVYTFYNVETSKTISELSFVFRSSDSSKQTNPDIFVTVYEEGLNIAITSPLNNSVYHLNNNIIITAASSTNADLELFIDGSSQQTATNTNAISSNYTFTSSGTHRIKAVATSGGESKESEISVYVKTPTQTESLPPGVKNGINKNNDGTVTLMLLAPQKTDVFLLGDFNNWTIHEAYQLKRDGEYFWITLNNLDLNIEYAYQYLIDYDIKIADPYAEKILDPNNDQYIPTTTYPNLKPYPTGLTEGIVSTFQVNEADYAWETTSFAKPAKDNLIIYELHLRDFTDKDSYQEALTHLDYLQSLGINAIELMPINEFEGNDSWGYNPSFYMALDKAYGTKNDFKKFVDECHKRGIAVLADVVFNHSFGQSPLLQMYFDKANNKPTSNNPWYNEQSNFANPDAQWGYDFNHESSYTTNFFHDVISYWINEYKIDGFRFDFTKGFSNTPYGTNSWGSDYDADRISILKNYADYTWNNHDNDTYLIFEHLADNSEETVLANYGIMLWGNMNHSYNQNTMGYANDTDISWISYKKRGWNNPHVVGYMESHDEERLMYKNLQYGNSSGDYNIKDLNTALARQELAGMFYFTIPGPKMIWQFGELGYDISIDENGRTGRKPIHWNYTENSYRKHIYSTWATLIAFKKQLPVFNTTDFSLYVAGLDKTIVLRHSEMDVVIIGNFDVVEKAIDPHFSKTGEWHEYFTGKVKNVSNQNENITLKPGEYKLYSTVKLQDPLGGSATDDSDNDGVNDTLDQCPNTLEGTTVNSNGCPVFSVPTDNFTIKITGETCTDKNNGQIHITTKESHSYQAEINGITHSFSTDLTVKNLPPNTYSVCITIIDEPDFIQCFEVNIDEAEEISGKANISKLGKRATATITMKTGTPPFTVLLNGKLITQTLSSTFTIPVTHGDLLSVSSDIACEGKFNTEINISTVLEAYPNPTSDLVEFAIFEKDLNQISVELYNLQLQLMSRKTYPVINGKIQLSLENYPKGVYFAKIYLSSPATAKIIKK